MKLLSIFSYISPASNLVARKLETRLLAGDTYERTVMSCAQAILVTL